MGKLAWFKFYPGDWMKDPELRSVSSGARGLWIDMLSLMFESARRGYLKLNNGMIVTAEHLSRMTGNSTDDTSRWLQELETSGVLSRTDDGTFYSRRMVRDEQERRGVTERVTRHRRNAHVTGGVTGPPVSVSDIEVDVVVGSKSKPSLEEVKAYCLERKNGIDPEKWFDYYTARGFKLNRTPMKDWKAAVRTWESNSCRPPQASPLTPEETQWALEWHQKEKARITGKAAQ